LHFVLSSKPPPNYILSFLYFLSSTPFHLQNEGGSIWKRLCWSTAGLFLELMTT
jgi:hypothetical protein